ncbi:MAG: CopG family transcriptional regulator [Phycisphaeraceae bacterium]|nr:CopG family transcriptional regulator [Phycisphaeraceae bacterium]
MARKETKVPLNLRVDESIVERLDILAEKMGMDRSEVARRVIKGGLTEMEKTIRTASSPIGEMLVRFAGLMEGNSEDRAELSKILRSIADDKQRSKIKKKKETG